MKIVHLCLNSLITDGWTYQDNLMPKYNRRDGHDVTIITSPFVGLSDGSEGIDERTEYINDDDVKIIRLSCKGHGRTDRFKRFPQIISAIDNEHPDILFVHSCQFLDVSKVVRYVKKNASVKVFVDNHADFSNSATNWFSKNILHGIIWKHYARKIEPYAEKFYGVLPARVDFLINVYGIPAKKCELLVMGADDEQIEILQQYDAVADVRKKFNIAQNDFLIVTGGKIDMAKQQTLLFMKAVKRLNRKDVKLLVFGSVEKQLLEKFNGMLDEQVIYAGWANGEDSYKYFNAADLVCFPGRHSVYWEQVVGLGKPMLVKWWEGTTHIDVGGNARYLLKEDVNEYYQELNKIVNNDDGIFDAMVHCANHNEKMKFLYSNISRRYVGYY